MNLHNNNMSWFFGVFATVALFTAGSYALNNNAAVSERVQFTNLSDADIDLILSVKAEMRAAKIQAN